MPSSIATRRWICWVSIGILSISCGSFYSPSFILWIDTHEYQRFSRPELHSHWSWTARLARTDHRCCLSQSGGAQSDYHGVDLSGQHRPDSFILFYMHVSRLKPLLWFFVGAGFF